MTHRCCHCRKVYICDNLARAEWLRLEAGESRWERRVGRMVIEHSTEGTARRSVSCGEVRFKWCTGSTGATSPRDSLSTDG